MKNTWAEKVLYSGLIVAVMTTFFAIVLQLQSLIYTTFAVLTAIGIMYAVVQMVEYLQGGAEGKSKSQMWIMIVSIVVTLVIIALSIFVYTGNLFNVY